VQSSGFLASQIKSIVCQRQRLLVDLAELSVVKNIWPSDANFIFLQCKRDVLEACAEQGIVLRDMQAKTGLKYAVRITVGTVEENDQLIDRLRCL